MKPLSLLAFLCSRLPRYVPAFAQKQKSAVTGRVATDGAFHCHCSTMDGGGGGGGGWEEGAGGGGGGGSALHAFESKLYNWLENWDYSL